VRCEVKVKRLGVGSSHQSSNPLGNDRFQFATAKYANELSTSPKENVTTEIIQELTTPWSTNEQKNQIFLSSNTTQTYQ
jgi:hypothetical protein